MTFRLVEVSFTAVFRLPCLTPEKGQNLSLTLTRGEAMSVRHLA